MNAARQSLVLVLLSAALLGPATATAQEHATSRTTQRSITDRTVGWPSWQQWRRVLLLEDYNTRVVLLGTTLLGIAAGAVGNFTLLRKRALMGDALAHATLPGVGLAFVGTTLAGGDGKSLGVLLAGAACSGILGLATIMFIRNATRLKEDAALGIVLSVFFGAGIAVLGVAQQMQTGHAAGLEGFIFGRVASMGVVDAQVIGATGLVATLACVLLFKELRLLCFDEAFAASRGYPVVLLDVLLMVLVVAVTLVGLQAVGLILMVAMLVTPAAAARFWTERMGPMALISAAIGAVSALLGAGMSAVIPKLPSGAMIVLVATACFLLSMFFGPARGIAMRTVRQWQMELRIERHHLLRAIYELLEERDTTAELNRSAESAPVPLSDLVTMRSWNTRQLRAGLRRARSHGLVRLEGEEQVRLTPQGFHEAEKLTYDHRLWEIFLTRYADVAPSQVDRAADAIEHVLDAKMIAELESLLPKQRVGQGVPPSPHPTLAMQPK